MIKSFDMSAEQLRALLAVARGDMPADLVMTGGRLVNVLSGEIYPAEVAVLGDRVAGVSAEIGRYQGREMLPLGGQYVAPGFFDAHVHIESSLLLPAEYANAVLPHGTTSVISDPHEIANVHGLEGIRFMLAASEGLALRVFVMLSSCVPATDMETAGARLGVEDLSARFCSFSTDDKQPDDLDRDGHIDHSIRKAIALGLDPMLAIQMATINSARHYGLLDLGAIAPGYLADIVTFEDPEDLRVTRTF